MNPSRQTVLLAEDNEDHADLIMSNLKRMNPNCAIDWVQDGEALLIKLQQKAENAADLPGIILLDIKMPRMNGLEALKEIRQNSAFAHIPVIMITTSASSKEIETCYELGANSYVNKAIMYGDLSTNMQEIARYWVTDQDRGHT